MATSRQQRDLLDQNAFGQYLDDATRKLNQRLSTNLILDRKCVGRAHVASKQELELLLDSKNEKELFEAFDTFLDLLLENLIKENALNCISDLTDPAEMTICALVQKFSPILAPLILMEDWFRSMIFYLTGRVVPSFFVDNNFHSVQNLCQLIAVNHDEARHWRQAAGFAPLDVK